MSTFQNIPFRTLGKLSKANTPDYNSMSMADLLSLRASKTSLTRDQKIAFLKTRNISSVEPDSQPSSPHTLPEAEQVKLATAASFRTLPEDEQVKLATAASSRTLRLSLPDGCP